MKTILLSLIISLSSLSITAQEKLPSVHIIATGGTIVGTASSSTSESYSAATGTVDQLLMSVPELSSIACISSEQPFSIASQDLTIDNWLTLSKCVNAALASDTITGVVIIHGTDLIEETAFWLALTTQSEKPIVLVGSMRPASSLSPDGPMNLFQAVAIAANPSSKNRGVLVAMNQKIYSAIHVVKSHTTDLEAISSSSQSPLGRIYGDRVVYSRPTEQAKLPYFNVSVCSAIPRVGILFGHADMESVLVDALVKNGYDGIVYAGVGNGNIHKSVIPSLESAVKKGVAVVRSTRVFGGEVARQGELDDSKYGFVCAGSISPQKARILLMLALTRTNSRDEIDALFNQF